MPNGTFSISLEEAKILKNILGGLSLYTLNDMFKVNFVGGAEKKRREAEVDEAFQLAFVLLKRMKERRGL